jgi:thiol-disulfide isomerase/thioredoxin
MNRLYVLALFFGLLISQITRAQSSTPLSFSPKKGYHSFIPAFLAKFELPKDDPFKTRLTGIPPMLKKIKYYRIILNEPQFFFQQFISGKLTKEELKQRGVSIESKDLQKIPMKVATYIITAEKTNGERVWIADTDANLSFSHESIQPLLIYDINRYTDLANNAIMIATQIIDQGHIKTLNLPLAFCLSPEGDYAYYNHPQYWQATKAIGDQTVLLQFGNFIEPFPNEIQARLAVVNQQQASQQIQTKELIGIGDYLALNKDVYQAVSMGIKHLEITLKLVDNPNSLESAQIGFLAPSFSERDLVLNSPISTQNLRGKYVLFDFWATWCAPCLAEFPNLKRLSDQYDPAKFEVIGIIGDSKEEDVKKLLINKGVSWRQVMANTLIKQYKIGAYPATYLVSPEGRIIDKDIKGKELEKVLSELIR